MVFDTKADNFVTRIGGFVGMTHRRATRPAPTASRSWARSELWVSDGDSTIKVVDLKTNTIAATIATWRQGAGQRHGLYHPQHPHRRCCCQLQRRYPTFINSILGLTPAARSTAKIPRCRNRPRTSSAPPITRRAARSSPCCRCPARCTIPKACLRRPTPKSGKLVKLHRDREAAICTARPSCPTRLSSWVCSSAAPADAEAGRRHGDLRHPERQGGRLRRSAPSGGNGGSTMNPKLGQYYHATTTGSLVVVDIKTRTPRRSSPRAARARWA